MGRQTLPAGTCDGRLRTSDAQTLPTCSDTMPRNVDSKSNTRRAEVQKGSCMRLAGEVPVGGRTAATSLRLFELPLYAAAQQEQGSFCIRCLAEGSHPHEVTALCEDHAVGVEPARITQLGAPCAHGGFGFHSRP